MPSLPPIAAIEIGTAKTLVLVGELRDDGSVLVAGMGECASRGVRKGAVVDFDAVSDCVRRAVQSAEEQSHVRLRQAHLLVTGGHVQTVVNTGSTLIRDRDAGVTDEDVEQVMDVASAVSFSATRHVLHTLCRHFLVDGQGPVTRPEGMSGARLSAEMLIVHGDPSIVRNATRAVTQNQIDVADVVFGGLCAAMAVLDDEQKAEGTLVLDLGAGSTDFAGFVEDSVVCAGSLGVGGDHVTNDLAMALSLPTAQAEELKRKSGSALIDPGGAGRRATIPASLGFSGRSVPLRAVQTVVHARMQETLRLVRARVEKERMLHRFAHGVLLTGGGAHLDGVCELAAQVFEMPCLVGRPRRVNGLATVTNGPEYAAAVGMLEFGFANQDAAAGTGTGGWLSGLFGRRT